MITTLAPVYLGAETFKRIREALEKLDNALASIATDKLRVSIVDTLPESPFNLTKIAGTALTGRDWSSDFAKLQNLDVALSTRASESTLSGIKAQTDKLTFDANNYLRINISADDIGIAKDSTLSSELTRIAKLRAYDPGSGAWQDLHTDGANRLKVQLDSIPNPPNLDVALSTRASESTLSAIKAQTDKLTFDANNFLKIALASDEIGLAKNSTLSSILPRKLSLDDGSGTYAEIYRSGNALLIAINEDKIGLLKKADLSFDANGYLNVNAQVVANPPNLDVALSTRASENTLSAIKTQTDKLTFDANNYLYVNLGSDSIGLAKDSTLSSILPRKIILDDGTGNYGEVYRSGNAMLISINEDKIGLARDSTLSSELPRIAKMRGYDYANAVWRDIAVDSSGRLLCTLK